MKKLIALCAIAALGFSAAAQCNTVISTAPVPTSNWEFCVTVTAPKLENNLFPYLMEVHYIDMQGKADTTWTYAGWAVDPANPTKRCYSPSVNTSPSYFFYNIATSSPIYARTSSVVIDNQDPASPYYQKNAFQIYDMVKNDPTKWCVSNTITVTWEPDAAPAPAPSPGKGKGKNK